VLQTGTTTTTIYPFKWYSVASSTGTGAKYATTTDYVLNGDTLLSTIDQQTASGVATGTAKTRYIHPDHLGSTNVVTDENDNVVQTLDSYPYGATRISVSTSTNEQRKYIGQFSDQSNLDYLNARYYSPAQGDFLSEDPVFLGQPKQQNLQDPQSLNSYSYSDDNPITKKDPTGLTAFRLGLGAVFWNVSIGAGLTIGTTDDGGYSVGPYFDAGPVVGGEVSGPEITTANLPEQYAITTGASASGGAGDYGVEMSKDETYYPYSKKAPQSSQEGTAGLIGGLGAGYVTEFYLPIVTWGNRPQVSTSPVVMTQVNNWNNINLQSSNNRSNVTSSSNVSSGGGGTGSTSFS
jgi:RHS repeat-associated protein